MRSSGALPTTTPSRVCQEGSIVIGVIQGDTHDIGKNLVKIMLEAAGFKVTDLGRDVKISDFVEAVKKERPRIVAVSTLMSTSMAHMKTLIDALEKEGLRDNVKVIVGGAPVSRAFAEKIGADGYSSNAAEAVRLVKKLLA